MNSRKDLLLYVYLDLCFGPRSLSLNVVRKYVQFEPNSSIQDESRGADETVIKIILNTMRIEIKIANGNKMAHL